MTEFLRDLRLALRGFARRPLFSGMIVLTLALGIGVNVAVFSFIQALLMRPLPFHDADRLVRILSFKGSTPGHVTQREIEDLQRESKSFEGIAAYYHSQYNVTGDGPPVAAPCAIGTQKLFEVLGAQFALGAPYAATGDFIRQYRVVLQHDFWQSQFGGDPEIVGSSIVLDGGSYVVDGVLAPGSDFPPGVELYRQVTEYHGLDGRRHSILARLAPGMTLDQARQELASFSQRWQESNPELNSGLHFEVVPLRDSWVGEARPYLLALMGAVAFVLLIAVVNVAHLLFSRASERRSEIAVRVSLGAGRWRLVRQLLAESMVYAVCGGVLGLFLAKIWLHLLTGLVRADLPAWMAIHLDPIALAATTVLVLVTGVLSGLAPAHFLSSASLGERLRSGARGTSGSAAGRLRDGLVVAEIALALVLLAGAGLMIRSFLALERQSLGFHAEDLFTVRIDPPYWSYNKIEQLTPFYDQALANLEGIPGVLGVAANQNLPLSGHDANSKRVVTLESQSTKEQEANPFIHLQSVGPGYFEVMGIPLFQGRVFSDSDRQETLPVAVLSRGLAERLWSSGSALGQRFKLGPPESEAPWITVAGIVGDVRSERRAGVASLDLYLSHLQHFTGDTYLVFRTRLSGESLERQIEAAIHRVDADIPLFDVAPMADLVAATEWQRGVTSHLFVLFGALALGLAALGVYGVISHNVAQRTREMGIRQAFGARPIDLFQSVVGQGLRLFFLGSVAGLLASLALKRLIVNLLYGVEATDPLTLTSALLTLLLALLAACFVPARRATRLNPVQAIRRES